MKIELAESGRQLANEDFLALEKAIGAQLPTTYRQFLRAHNGGRPTPDIIDIDGAPFKGTAISWFLGVDLPNQAGNILWNLENLEGCVENQLLPVADDPYANVFVIDLNAQRYGQIFYFDSDEIPPRPYLVANDFNEFLSKIRAHTPEELADIHAAALGPDNP